MRLSVITLAVVIMLSGATSAVVTRLMEPSPATAKAADARARINWRATMLLMDNRLKAIDDDLQPIRTNTYQTCAYATHTYAVCQP